MMQKKLKNFLMVAMAGLFMAWPFADARASGQWLLQFGAEIYTPLDTNINTDAGTATIKHINGGGFSGLFGYRFAKGLEISTEYIFLQNHGLLTKNADGVFATTAIDRDRFAIHRHIVLANVGYYFGKNWGLENFGFYLGSGLGVAAVNAAVKNGEGYGNVAMMVPFKFAFDYIVSKRFVMGIYGRYGLPLFATGEVNPAGDSAGNGTPATMSSGGGFTAGLSLAGNF